jgi:hypothetical protein
MAVNSIFNYREFGDNPWVKPTKQISDLVARMLAAVPDPRARTAAKGTGSSYARWGSDSPGPDDPAVRGYMDHVLGGQRNALDEYVRRAAGAGIRRSGLNVRGGPALDSTLHQAAMRNLAGGYSGRFREAMNFAKQLRGESYRKYRDSMTDLQNLLASRHGYLSSQSDWTKNLAGLKHTDWLRELGWERDAPFRSNRLAMSDLNLKRARMNMNWAREDRGERQRRLTEAMQNVKRISNMSRGYGDWTIGDAYDWERAMVQLGYWSPLNRSIRQSVSVGGSVGKTGGKGGAKSGGRPKAR